MKNTLSILFLLLFINADGQNYNCLQFGPLRYFINGQNYVRGIRIDSVRASGSDTIYHPYLSDRINNYTPGLYAPPDNPGASWVGKNVIKHADGTFVFDNYWDTVVIKTQAHTGDSWVFFDDSTRYSYIATVTAQDTMTVLGILDSVKKIVITADSAGIPYAGDPVNNFEIILSKHNGFVCVFDLFTFPYHRPDISVSSPHAQIFNFIRFTDYYLDVVLNNLGSGDLGLDNQPNVANSIFVLFPFHNPTLMEIYDFAVEDVFETSYSEYFGGGDSHDYTALDSILTETISPYSVSYTGTIHEMDYHINAWTIPPTVTSTYSSGIYTGGGDLSRLLDSHTMPEELNSGYLLHYFPAPVYEDYMCDSPAVYEIDVDYRGGGFVVSDMGADPNSSYTMYSPGYGIIRKATGNRWEQTLDQHYCFYRKNGVSCGTFNDVIASLSVKVPQRDNIIQISPNPASDHINVSGDKGFGKNAGVLVYDMTGRNVYRVPINESDKQISINLDSWADGLYMVIVQNDGGVVKKEKVVVRK